jgi:DNA repair protein RAD5
MDERPNKKRRFFADKAPSQDASFASDPSGLDEINALSENDQDTSNIAHSKPSSATKPSTLPSMPYNAYAVTMSSEQSTCTWTARGRTIL